MIEHINAMQDYKDLKNYEQIETFYDDIEDYTKLLNDIIGDRVEALKYIVRANKEIERLNKEKENLTNIVSNKIIKDYDIETPLKYELNNERSTSMFLREENTRLNNIINKTSKKLEMTLNCIKDYMVENEEYIKIHTDYIYALEEQINKLKGSDK